MFQKVSGCCPRHLSVHGNMTVLSSRSAYNLWICVLCQPAPTNWAAPPLLLASALPPRPPILHALWLPPASTWRMPTSPQVRHAHTCFVCGAYLVCPIAFCPSFGSACRCLLYILAPCLACCLPWLMLYPQVRIMCVCVCSVSLHQPTGLLHLY